MRPEKKRLFTGDCPDFRGASRVALQTGAFAAKMGLSPLRRLAENGPVPGWGVNG